MCARATLENRVSRAGEYLYFPLAMRYNILTDTVLCRYNHTTECIMENKLDVLIEALAELLWDHMEDKVREEARDIAREVISETEFEVDVSAEVRPL